MLVKTLFGEGQHLGFGQAWAYLPNHSEPGAMAQDSRIGIPETPLVFPVFPFKLWLCCRISNH